MAAPLALVAPAHCGGFADLVSGLLVLAIVFNVAIYIFMYPISHLR